MMFVFPYQLLCRRHSVLLERLNGGVRWYQTGINVNIATVWGVGQIWLLARQGSTGVLATPIE